jgi:putative hydrolase of the HAD superfamily
MPWNRSGSTFLSIISRACRRHPLPHHPLPRRPDTPDVLHASRNGLKVGAVSTPINRAGRWVAQKYGLVKYIDALVVSSEVGWEKPHPAIFREALHRLDVDAKETVFVGDMAWPDIKGAQALGMKAVLTRQYRHEDPGDSKPDSVIDRLPDVVGYVDRLNKDDP